MRTAQEVLDHIMRTRNQCLEKDSTDFPPVTITREELYAIADQFFHYSGPMTETLTINTVYGVPIEVVNA